MESINIYLVELKEKKDKLHETMEQAIKDAEWEYELAELPASRLDLEYEMIENDYKSDCIHLINEAINDGCSRNDLEGVFGSWLVDMVN